MTMDKFVKLIDHTLLKPEATPADIKQLCAEAKEMGFASVCVNSKYVALAHQELNGSGVKTCCTVGFPLGAADSESKAYETATAVQNGVEEVDMVIDVGAMKAGLSDVVYSDIVAVKNACGNTPLKVIIETCLLTDAEKEKACILVKNAGAEFVKTSTGFSSGGATVEDVALMRKTVGPEMGVKAAGGVRTVADVEAMVAAGATRIGTSGGYKMAQELQGK